MIRVGDKVMHDYSSHQGVVLAKRKDRSGYNYQVQFAMPENGEEAFRVDWYRRDVLERAA